MGVRAFAQRLDSIGVPVIHNPQDLDELAAASGSLRPNRVSINERGAQLCAWMNSVSISPDISLHRLSYGCPVIVTPDRSEDENFLFVITTDGQVNFRYGGSEVDVAGSGVIAIAPYREFRSQMSEDFDQIIINVRREEVETVIALLADAESANRTEFFFPDDVIAPPLKVVKLFEALLLTLGPEQCDASVMLSERLQRLTLECLLLAIPSLRERVLTGRAAGPRAVEEAQTYMMARLAEPLPITQVAQHVGVSPRALQLAFRKNLDSTPTAWLKTRRLLQARKLLSSGDLTHTSVAEIAHSVGLNHLGSFAISFRDRFGVSPSELLRRTRHASSTKQNRD